MRLGHLNTNKSWPVLLKEVKEELDKWGIEDYLLPTLRKSQDDGEVVIQIARGGNWEAVRCGNFTHWTNGAQRNLCAIREALRAHRLADQRGMGSVFAQVAKLALPDPEDPYQILNIRRGSGIEEIRSAYRKLMQTAHPDKPNGSRPAYDRVRRAGEQLGVA